MLVHLPLGLIAGLFRLVRVDVSGLLAASVRDLSRSDALIDLAGVSFIDGREKYLPFNILTIWPAMLMGVPVFKLSQAVGPFRQTLNHWVAGSLLKRCRMLVPRGRTTLEHLSEIDIPADRLFPAPDTAFCFREQDSLSDEGVEEITTLLDLVGGDRRGEVIGICPSSVIASKASKEGWDYVGFLAEVVRTLVADGQLVVLFPNATRADAGDALRNNDLPVIRDVAAATSLAASDGLLWVKVTPAPRSFDGSCVSAMSSAYRGSTP